jgi:quercetin dioxygenase-like cupin family protein
MNRPWRTGVLVGAALLVLAGIPAAQAQDAAVVNAATITVRLDNEHVRVLEAVLEPGTTEAMHSHPRHVLHVLSGGTMRSHTPDGKSSEARLESGQVVYREPLTHWAENIGDTTVRVLLIELKH